MVKKPAKFQSAVSMCQFLSTGTLLYLGCSETENPKPEPENFKKSNSESESQELEFEHGKSESQQSKPVAT